MSSLCFVLSKDTSLSEIQFIPKPVNANSGLKVNRRVRFCEVLHDSNSKLVDKQYEKRTSPKSYKNEIEILANPGLV